MKYLKTYEKVSKEAYMNDQYNQIIDDCLIYINYDGFIHDVGISTGYDRTSDSRKYLFGSHTFLTVSIIKKDKEEFNTKDILPYLKDMVSHLEAVGLKLKESIYYIGTAMSVQPGSIKFIGNVREMEVVFI